MDHPHTRRLSGISGVLRAASDSFREAAYSGTYGESGIYVYEADRRDVGITGFPSRSFLHRSPLIWR
jgi:hypothetical protein